MQKIIEKKIRNENISFSNQRALYWHGAKMLILSDAHIGKSAHFRKHGVAIPAEVQLEDLRKLQLLIDLFTPESVLVVGDLFHAGYNSDLDIFKEWRQKIALDFLLVRGNHDKLKCEVYEDMDIQCFEKTAAYFPFKFSHIPVPETGEHFVISGHIHPGFILQGKNERLRLPCFAFTESQLILPAFSRFTGLDTRSLGEEYRNIVFTEEAIFEI